MAEKQGLGVFVRFPTWFADLDDGILSTGDDQTIGISFDGRAESDGVDERRAVRSDGAIISRGFRVEKLPFSNGCISGCTDDEFLVGKSNGTDLGEYMSCQHETP